MSSSGQNTLIIILSGILIAAVLAAGAIVFLGSDSPADLTGGNFWSRISIFSPDSSTTQSDSQIVVPEFNTNPLNRKSYTDLNTSLINNGLLPVRPDPAAGKANPFL